MEKYKVIAPRLVLGAFCLVELSEDQADARTVFLKRHKGDVYQVLENISFKAGEVIGLDGKNLSKATLACLEPVDGKHDDNPPPATGTFKVAHVGGGKYVVLNEQTGARMCDLTTKDNAETFLKELLEEQDGV